MRILESQIKLTDIVQTHVAAKLMFINLYTDLQWFQRIGPMENASLLWVDLKRAQVFALGLHDGDHLEGAIDHKVSRLKADKFREAEWLWQVRYD